MNNSFLFASPNGEQWQPVRNQTRICSVHFVGNEKSSIAQHPAYVPTLFPSCYKKDDGVLPKTKLERYQRLQRRRSYLLVAKPPSSVDPPENPDIEESVAGSPRDAPEVADNTSNRFVSVCQRKAEVNIPEKPHPEVLALPDWPFCKEFKAPLPLSLY
ncbi:hypothetical protein HPB49_007041 [Dermacentor silvarum]|uniref:Uncharacterized protein n=1 Tax=Dermacentor silvarum TaxID=543639 RepID=A0ACB8DBC5_DERSI|nr:hypothetical protein HPB49_007041 [Dermacentor silvarum]